MRFPPENPDHTGAQQVISRTPTVGTWYSCISMTTLSRRPGGRSAIVRAKVLAAASELVNARGLQNVTMPEIAERAGVAATSLYRRWGNVGSLLLEMAVERLSTNWPLPNKGSIEKDLKSWSGSIAVALTKSPEKINFFRVLMAATDVAPEKRLTALAPRRAQVENMLRRSRERGEAPPSFEDVIDHVLAPLYVRALVGLPLSRPFAERLVDRLLAYNN